MSIDMLLYIVASVLFLLAAVARVRWPEERFDLVAAGLLAWVLTNIF